MMCRNVKMLAATMVAVVLLAAGAWAQGPWDCGATAETVTATLGENGTLTISGTGAMANYTITTVPWSGYRSSITGAVIEEGVTNIGNYAFYNCTGLTSVTLPANLTSIGNLAFRGCENLTSVTIPSSVTSIGQQAFAGCSSLTSIETSEGNSAYSSVDGVLFNKDKSTLVAYPGGKQGPYSIPSGVTAIEGYAFFDCDGLTSVTIPSGVTSIGGNAFQYCAGLTSVTIPSSVISIETSAFFQCTGLTSVTIPNSVASIGGAAFYGCTGLMSITSLAEVPPNLDGPNVFQNMSAVLYVPDGSADAYRAANQWKSLGILDGSGLPMVWECGASPNAAAVTATLNTADGTFTISGTGAMADYTSTTVPWAAYRRLITSVVIEDGVTSIGNWAFYGCADLTSVTIPSSVASIGTYVFSDCTGLTSVTLPTNLTSIGNYAFRSCTSLTDIEVGNSNSAYSSVAGVLFDKDKSTLVAYPVGKQGAYSIPNGVASIGLAAFYGCAGLTSVTIPNDVTSIGERTFYGCTGLTSVTVPNGVTSIGTSVFSGCTGLTSVTIGSDVESIGNSAFSGCTGLTSVTSLIDVPLTINSNVFNNVPVASATLYVPEDAVEAYRAADVWKSFVTIEAKPKNSVTSGDRVIPQTKPKEEATVIAPITVLSGEFTAGPNPVLKQSGIVNFYHQGKRVANSELRIYDATGNVISKVKISDKALNSQARRQVGSWDLKDKSGRPVSEGTYLVKGVVKTSDGKGEKVSVILGVR